MPNPAHLTTAPPPWPARDAAHLLVDSAAMQGLEGQLFASGLPVAALMEKAALGVAQRLLAGSFEPALADRLHQQGAVVLVGPGHNGGDGLVVARELHLAGLPVRLWSPFERHKPLTDAHLRHARWLGMPLLEQPPDAGDGALWIDALFGIGQNRPPATTIQDLLIERQRLQPQQLLALDGPTGLCADTGRLLGTAAACAAITYAIGLIKQGWLQDPALAWVGRLERIALGLPASLLEQLPGQQPLALGPADIATAPWPALPAAASKYQRGRLLVLAGSQHYRGAAHLALAGASAAGCGSLRAALPEAITAGLWQVRAEVVTEPPLALGAEGGLLLGGLAETALERLDAVLVGPGIGSGPASLGDVANAEARCWERLQRFGGLLVLDADGLNRLAAGPPGSGDGPEAAWAWLQGRGGGTWLTPHPGEFARLFPDLAPLPPLEAAAAAARRTGATVLLKGARSVIAAADGRRWQLRQASPLVARAGLGDVLAGYAAARGAMAVAAQSSVAAGISRAVEPAWLAAAALEHAAAGLAAAARLGSGAAPQAVAEQLAHCDRLSSLEIP